MPAMKYFKYEFLPPFVAIYRHNDISIFLSVGKYWKGRNVEPLFISFKARREGEYIGGYHVLDSLILDPIIKPSEETGILGFHGRIYGLKVSTQDRIFW